MGRYVPLEERLEYWQGKAAKMRLLNESKTYIWEYETCLERIALYQRMLQKKVKVGHHHSSSTKASP